MLDKLNSFATIVEEYWSNDRPPANVDSFRNLAGELAVEAEIRKCNGGGRYFAEVQATHWRAKSPDLLRSIAELRAKLIAAQQTTTRCGDELLIPVEHQSLPKSKDELARIHHGENHSNPTVYFNRLRHLTLMGEPNGKLWIVDLRQWPESTHKALRS